MKSDRENNRNISKKINGNSVFETNKLLSTVVAVMLITTAFMIAISPSIHAASEDNLLSNEFFEEWVNDSPENWIPIHEDQYKSEEPLVGDYSMGISHTYVGDRDIEQITKIVDPVPERGYGEIWVRGSGFIRLGVKAGHGSFSHGDWVRLEDDDWIKVTYDRPASGDGNPWEFRIRTTSRLGGPDDEDVINVDMQIGAAWLGAEEPPEDWLVLEYHMYQFNIEGLASCYEVEEALVDPEDDTFDGMTPVQLNIIIDEENDIPYDGMVRVNPVGADDLQLWAQNTESVWHDINDVGWGPSGGFMIDLDAVTEIFVIATDFFGDQDVTLELVDVTGEYSATDGIIISQVETVTACEPIVEWELTISSTVGGSVIDPGEGTFTYDDGTVVDLVAEADAGYHFVEWMGDVITIADQESASTTITMLDDYAITAVFVIDEHTLTIDSTEGGEVTAPGEGDFTYEYGIVVDLVATPETAYHFVEWTGEIDTLADPESASTTITMLDDYAITAVFAEDPVVEWELTISSTVGGTVIEPGIGTFTYDDGDVVPFVAVADPGYHFVEWTGDTNQIDDVYAAETNITMLGDYEVTAVFAIDEHDLTITCSPGWNLFSVDYFIDIEKSVTYGDEPERVFTYINGAWVGGSNPESMELALSHLSPLTAVYVKVAEGEESILGIIYKEDEGLFPPEEKTDTQHLTPGWNLISVPVDSKAGTLLNTLIQGSLVNLYDQGYVDTGDIPDYDLEAAKGYWVNMNTAHTFTLIVPPLPD